MSSSRKISTLCAVLAMGFVTGAVAQEATIKVGEDQVTFVNLLTPTDGVTIEQLAEQLTLAMKEDASKMPGFRTASVHISQDNSYVLNYAQWDSVASVDQVVAAVGEGQLPELAKAFSMATAEFHPYTVFSVTPTGD